MFYRPLTDLRRLNSTIAAMKSTISPKIWWTKKNAVMPRRMRRNSPIAVGPDDLGKKRPTEINERSRKGTAVNTTSRLIGI